MNEIINKVFETEEKAEKILNDARAESSEINRTAQKEFDDTVQQARQDAKKLQQEILDRERALADKAYEQAIAAHRQAISGLLESKSDEIKKTAAGIVNLVTGSSM